LAHVAAAASGYSGDSHRDSGVAEGWWGVSRRNAMDFYRLIAAFHRILNLLFAAIFLSFCTFSFKFVCQSGRMKRSEIIAPFCG